MKPDPYLDAVARLGCCICGQHAQIHHISGGSAAGRSGMGLRASDLEVIGLCAHHHVGDEGIHRGVISWEARFGKQTDLLAEVQHTVAALHTAPPKRQAKPSKILPR